MEPPKIVTSGQRILLGFSFFGDPFTRSGGWSEENEIGRLWKRFMVYWEKNQQAFRRVRAEAGMVEAHIYHAETPLTGEFEVFVGVEVAALEAVPVELTVKILPPATYAVFTLAGDEITSDWSKMIYTDWAPGSGYEVIRTHSLQQYDERFKGVDQIAASTLDVYIPVQKIDPRQAGATPE